MIYLGYPSDTKESQMDVKVGNKVRIGSKGAVVEVIAVEGIFFFYNQTLRHGSRQHGYNATSAVKMFKREIIEVVA